VHGSIPMPLPDRRQGAHFVPATMRCGVALPKPCSYVALSLARP
jgi:hypothetical protein